MKRLEPLLWVLSVCLSLFVCFPQLYEDLAVVSTAVDILNLIAEFNSGILRDHALHTKDANNEVSV